MRLERQQTARHRRKLLSSTLTKAAGWPIPSPSIAPKTPTVLRSFRMSAVFALPGGETQRRTTAEATPWDACEAFHRARAKRHYQPSSLSTTLANALRHQRACVQQVVQPTTCFAPRAIIVFHVPRDGWWKLDNVDKDPVLRSGVVCRGMADWIHSRIYHHTFATFSAIAFREIVKNGKHFNTKN